MPKREITEESGAPFYYIKLPFMMVALLSGFVIEFVITAPFIIMSTLDNLFGRRSG